MSSSMEQPRAAWGRLLCDSVKGCYVFSIKALSKITLLRESRRFYTCSFILGHASCLHMQFHSRTRQLSSRPASKCGFSAVCRFTTIPSIIDFMIWLHCFALEGMSIPVAGLVGTCWVFARTTTLVPMPGSLYIKLSGELMLFALCASGAVLAIPRFENNIYIYICLCYTQLS